MDQTLKVKAKKEYELLLKNSTIILNDVKKVSEVINSERKSYYTIGHGNVFVINNIQGSNALLKLKDAFFEDVSINNNYTEKQIQNMINEHMLTEKEKEFELLLTNITNVEKEEYEVFLPIYGAVIDETIKFDKVDFISGKLLISKLKESEKNLLDEKASSNVYAHITIKSATKERAVEMATIKIGKIVNILRFFVNSKKRNADLSLNSSLRIRKDGIAISKHQSFRTSSYIGAMHTIDLNGSFFTNNSTLNKVISIENKQEKETNLERRLLLAIQWLGMALSEDDLIMKFTKAMISIEALLQTKSEAFSDKLADIIAFILGENKEERIDIRNNFKRLYNRRSKIAHGEGGNLGTFDLYLLIDYANLVIHWTIENIDDYKSIDELNNYINGLKFS